MTSLNSDRNLIGATIIAGVIFWILNFASGVFFENTTTTTWDFWSATIKAPIFAVIFHFAHKLIARTFNWYE